MGERAMGCLLAIPAWQTAEAVIDTSAGDYTEHHVILCDVASVSRGTLESLLAGSRCVSLASSAGSTLAERYGEHALACFEQVQEILRSGPPGRVLMQLVIAGGDEGAVFSGPSG